MAGNEVSDERADTETRFKPGNRFWEARSTHGRGPKYETAEQLEAACTEYFEWVEDNPLYERKAFGTGVTIDVPKMRAMSLMGLSRFIGITYKTWVEWRSSRPDFCDVMATIEDAVRQQKFEGASADLLNANIIARDLGLADKRELAGSDGGPVEVSVSATSRLIRAAAGSGKAGASQEPVSD